MMAWASLAQIVTTTYQAHPLFFYASVIAVAALVGSFLNVVIYRLPIKQVWEFKREAHDTLGLPFEEALSNHAQALRSHCPTCGNLIAWYDNLPVLSYIALRGQCRSCKTAISAKYPIIESLFVLLSVVCAWQFGPSIILVMALVYTGYLLSMAVIDWETTYLFDAQTLPLMWIGLVFSVFASHISPADAIAGAALGYFGPYAFTTLYSKARGLSFSMGGGDLKLLAAVGAWCGPLAPFVALGIGSVLFVAWFAIDYLRGRDVGMQTMHPLGPFLAVAAWGLFVFPQWRIWIPG